MYNYNYMYSDEELDHAIIDAGELINRNPKPPHVNTNIACIIDSTGASLRGLSWIYAKALIDLGYKLLYIVPFDKARKKGFALLESFLTKNEATIIRIKKNSGRAQCQEIYDAVCKYMPKHLFFHGFPHDTSAFTAIGALPEGIARYLINLTDHAFWLGAKSFDRCLEFRYYGENISINHRGIPENAIGRVPFYPIQMIAQTTYEGLPFEEDTPFFLSGGSSYKIEGSSLFVEMVAKILKQHEDVHFLFLSNMKSSSIAELAKSFPSRVHCAPERQDLIQVMEKALFYLSTYPIYGGLMTQIAASAGKVPLALLLDGYEPSTKMLQANGHIDFNSENELITEANRLIEEPDYRSMRGKEMKRIVLGPETFAQRIKAVVNGDVGEPFPHSESNDEAFRETYSIRNNSYARLAEINFQKEDLFHMTIFRPIAWVGFFQKLAKAPAILIMDLKKER